MCGIDYYKCKHLPKRTYQKDIQGRQIITANFDLAERKTPFYFGHHVKLCIDCDYILEDGGSVQVKLRKKVKTITEAKRKYKRE